MPAEAEDHPGSAGNLPIQITPFIGRKAESASLKAAMRHHRLVTLVGEGGAGKTRLALEVAGQMSRGFAQGCWLVDLGKHPPRTTIEDFVASALSLSRPVGRWTPEELVQRLGDEPRLLLLDNCEHVVDEVAALVQALLSGSLGLTILATTRQALGVVGEHLVTLGGLSVPEASPEPSPHEMMMTDSVALFVQRGRHVVGNFDLTPDNAEAVTHIVRRLEGMPLSLELAAARLPVLAPQQIATRLDDQFRVLAATRSAEPRHQSLHAAIGWSYGLCSPQEQLLWARLSVFPSDFDLDAAEAVTAGGDIDRAAVLALIGGLIEKSIVRANHVDGSTARYQLSDPVREFGRERLLDLEPHMGVSSRLLDHYGRIASGLSQVLFGPSQAAQVRQFARERANMEAALLIAIREQEWGTADTLACAIALASFTRGSLGESMSALDAVIKPGPVRSTTRVRTLWLAAWVAVNQGDLGLAEERAKEARRLGQLLDDQAGLGHALQFLGQTALLRGDLAQANRDTKQAVDLGRRLGDSHLLVTSLVRYAEVLEVRGAVTDAENALTEAIGISQQEQEVWCRGFALWTVALLRQGSGRGIEALPSAQEGLRSMVALGDVVSVGQALEALAWCSADVGDHVRAAVLLGASERTLASAAATLSSRLARRRRECEARESAELGPEEFGRQMDRGRAMGLNEVVPWALGDEPRETVTLPSTDRRHVEGRPARRHQLTERELEVARLIGEGLRNRDIADRLVLSTRTIDAHVANIFSKLGFTSRAQVSAWTRYLNES